MKWSFWGAALLIGYTYMGYPILLWVRAKFCARVVRRGEGEPSISIVIAVYNEIEHLRSKLDNLAALDYPVSRREVVIVSDGSTDGTNDLLRAANSVRAVICPYNRGKAVALNDAIAAAAGDIVVFTDARQILEASVLREIAANFHDPSVGCVSGELLFRNSDPSTNGVSFYWRLEKMIRKLEAASGSAVGATGAIYAVRRSLLPVVPAGTLLDDVFIPLTVARQGYRVVFEPAARAWDSEPLVGPHEFRRKVRTLVGNYQLLQIAPWLLTSANPLRFRLISHKLLRLIVPFLLVAMFVTAWAMSSDRLYLTLAIAQTAFYLLGALDLQFAQSLQFAQRVVVLLVIRAGSTPLPVIEKAKAEFRATPLVGAVLNRSEQGTGYSSYYYSSPVSSEDGDAQG